MRFLPFRRKDKKKSLDTSAFSDEYPPNFLPRPPLFPPTRRSAQLLAQLPPPVLQRIFAFVCPHANDESYDTCEGSANDSGCMLCDLRDLSHCAKVSRAWRKSTNAVLYHSVRIDPVHYCRLEALLAERRKKTSRFDRNGVPEDVAQARLRLFRRTVRDDPTRIGKLVQFLKVPYMLRESCHVELAQTIAVLPNLHYVDLPEDMFADEPAFATLRLEVQARCPDIRKMSYVAGAERSFAILASGQIWPQLEVLELTGLHIDPLTTRNVLGSLEKLRALKISNMPTFTDEVMAYGEGLPSLPPLEELILTDTPRVTTAGIVEYLAWNETQQALKVLTLKNTGVDLSALQDILAMAPVLQTMAIQTSVQEASTADARPLASKSIQTLRFEISGSDAAGPYSGFETSYYTHLATSIITGGFPKLRRLYVHDETFPDQLQGLPPPNMGFKAGHTRASSNPGIRIASGGLTSPGLPPSQQRRPNSKLASPPRFAGANPSRLSSNNPFAAAPTGLPMTHTLEVFTKSDEFGQWNFSRVDPFLPPPSAPGMGGGGTGGGGRGRPMSSYGLAADVTGQGWDARDSRRSIMVGNGMGAFLAVPGGGGGASARRGSDTGLAELAPPPRLSSSSEWRPRSSGGESMRGSRDLWS